MNADEFMKSSDKPENPKAEGKVKPTGQVYIQLGRLENNLQALDVFVEELYSVLTPVLVDNTTKDSSSVSSTEPPANTYLAQNINSANMTLEHYLNRIHSLIERIEI